MYIEIFFFGKILLTSTYFGIKPTKSANSFSYCFHILFIMKLAFNFRLKGATDKIAF